MKERILRLATEMGFCSGVERAVNTVDALLDSGETHLVFLHELVHNEIVVEHFRQRGVRFIEQLSEAKPNETIIFSAHGVGRITENFCIQNKRRFIDLTCPLVKKIHEKINRAEQSHKKVLLIGHPQHQEMIGSMGQTQKPFLVVENVASVEALEASEEPIVALAQTTLATEALLPILEALKKKFSHLVVEGQICYATSERQSAVRQLAKTCDTLFVIGSEKSSNTMRLVEVAKAIVPRVILLNSLKDFEPSMIENSENLGLTAGASTPYETIQLIVKHLVSLGYELK